MVFWKLFTTALNKKSPLALRKATFHTGREAWSDCFTPVNRQQALQLSLDVADGTLRRAELGPICLMYEPTGSRLKDCSEAGTQLVSQDPKWIGHHNNQVGVCFQ